MRFARIENPPLVPPSFEAAMHAAGAVAVDGDRDCYTPVAGVDGQVLVVNRVDADGSSWTAVAGVTPQRTAVRVVFINGCGRRGSLFDIPHSGGEGLREPQSRAVAGLVLAAPRAFARRLCNGNVVLDRLIEAAWCGERALQLSEGEYLALERRLSAPAPGGREPLSPDLLAALRVEPIG